MTAATHALAARAERPDGRLISLRAPAIGVVVVLIFVYQFLPMAHFFAPLQIAGKNVYTVAPAVIMLLVLAVCWRGITRTVLSMRAGLLLIALACTWLLILAARGAFYGEHADILFQRFVLTPFIYSAVFMYLTRNSHTRKLLGTTIVAVAAVQAVLGIIHAHMFPYIELVPDKNDVLHISFEGNGAREVGTMVSSSLFAGVLVCGQFVLLGEKRLSFWIQLLLMCVITYAVTLSGSRYAIAVSVLLAGGLIANRRIDRTAPIILSVVALGALIVLALGDAPFESRSIIRLNEDDGGRFEKLILAIDVMSSHWYNLFIGAPSVMIESASTAGGVSLSDNSYALVGLQLGIPLLLVWVACGVAFIVRRPPGVLAPLMVLYFFVNLGITNSVLWEPWLFYFAVALWVVRRGSIAGETKLVG